MGTYRVADGVDPLPRAGKPSIHRFEEVDRVGDGAPRVGKCASLAGGRAEGANDVPLLAPTVIDLLTGGPRGSRRRLLACSGDNQTLTRPTLAHFGSHLVQPDHPSDGHR